MNQEFLSERRKAMEEAFFANQNKTLLQRLRETDAARQKKAALAAASGISDDNVLEKLVALNIGSDTLAALSLVPIVKMAWADGAIDDKERKAALSAAAEIGLSNDSVSRALFEQWIAQRPPVGLFHAWKEYIGALLATMDEDARRALKQDILNRARAIAEATGGFLGIGRKVSYQEEIVLQELNGLLGSGRVASAKVKFRIAI